MNSDPSPTVSPPEKLNLSTKLAFGAGDLGPAITANISVFYGLLFLTNAAGLDPRLAGSVLMVGKIWDAVNDPIVGVLSDRTVHPWGRRYPWMVFGAIPFGILFFLQWIVPGNNQWFLFGYYVIIGILFNTAYTAVNLPYTALTPELTSDYDERTILNSFRFSFSIGGGIFSLIVATIISVLIPDSPDSTYQEYLVLGGVCAILSVIPLFWCFLGTRKRVWSRHSTSGNQDNSDSLPLVEQIKIALSNRPFLLVIGIYLCSWLGVQLTASILAYFVINWMGLPKVMFPLMAMVVQGTSLVMLFVWSAISKRYGKKSIYFMGMGLWIIAQAGLFFLQPGQVGLMYILAILAGCGVSTAYLVPWSMIPDVIDLDELNTGQRREGVFYSFMVFLQKIGLAVGLFLVGQSLGFAGFQPTTPDNPVPIQPDSALLAIRLAISLLPTLFLVIGMIFTFLYPITKEVHTDILLQLSEKKRNKNLN